MKARPILHILIFGAVLLMFLNACGSPLQTTAAANGAQAAPIARAFTPTPVNMPALPTVPVQSIQSNSIPTPSATLQPATIVANAVPVNEAPLNALGQNIDAYLNSIVDAQWFQGSVLVARNGQIILSRGYGFADSDQGTRNTAQTRFRLASITKQFTSAAIMLLQARGLLNVHDSICAYLDDCPAQWRPITLHHLLTHTSGLPNYTDFADYEATQMQAATPDQLIARFRTQALLSDPGSTYSYENSDYVLLGYIIERVSGQSYADFLHDTIFAPLQMNDTGMDSGLGGAPGYALGYSSVGTKAPPLDASTLFSAGSLYSTVEDMYRWDQALYTDQLLPQTQRDQMFTPFLQDYAYGWKINTLNDRQEICHAGLIDGFATFIARFPNDHVTVIVLSNLTSADAPGIGNYIASLVLGG